MCVSPWRGPGSAGLRSCSCYCYSTCVRGRAATGTGASARCRGHGRPAATAPSTTDVARWTRHPIGRRGMPKIGAYSLDSADGEPEQRDGRTPSVHQPACNVFPVRHEDQRVSRPLLVLCPESLRLRYTHLFRDASNFVALLYRITSKTALYVFVDLRFDSKTTKTKMIFQNPLYPNLISCESTTSKIRPAPCSSISLRISVCRASDPVIRPRLGDAPLSYAVCRGPP